MRSERPTRHHWVRLDAGWERHLRSPLEPEARERISDWCAQGRPFVVAREDLADTDEDLRLGLALPDKRRVCLHVGRGAALSWRPPPALRDVLRTAPEVWRSTLRRIHFLGETIGVPVGVFGSLAWEYLSGVRYVRPDSDVDLLFSPSRWTDVERLLSELEATSRASSGVRLDGEVLLPDGGAVAWRELASRPHRLLIKGPRGAGLRGWKEIPALFGEASP